MKGKGDQAQKRDHCALPLWLADRQLLGESVHTGQRPARLGSATATESVPPAPDGRPCSTNQSSAVRFADRDREIAPPIASGEGKCCTPAWPPAPRCRLLATEGAGFVEYIVVIGTVALVAIGGVQGVRQARSAARRQAMGQEVVRLERVRLRLRGRRVHDGDELRRRGAPGTVVYPVQGSYLHASVKQSEALARPLLQYTGAAPPPFAAGAAFAVNQGNGLPSADDKASTTHDPCRGDDSAFSRSAREGVGGLSPCAP
jgi:hypothetical protein